MTDRTARGGYEETHRGPGLPAMTETVDQVDEDRQEHQRQTPEKVWLQKSHGPALTGSAGHQPRALDQEIRQDLLIILICYHAPVIGLKFVAAQSKTFE